MLSTSGDELDKKVLDGLNMDDVTTGGYKCPSSVVPNIVNKLGSDTWYTHEDFVAPDSSFCKELSSQDANTYIQYGIHKDRKITLTIHDCVNYKLFNRIFEKGEL